MIPICAHGFGSYEGEILQFDSMADATYYLEIRFKKVQDNIWVASDRNGWLKAHQQGTPCPPGWKV